MRRSQILAGAAAAAILAAGATGYWWLGEGSRTAAPTKAGDIDAATGRRILYWTDPMIPNFKSDHPGKSPMNMDMVPVYAPAASAPSSSASAAMAAGAGIHQTLGVRTAPVTEGVLQPQVEAVGTVLVNERSEVVLQARAAGYVQHLFVRATFDPVRRGQAIATLVVPQFAAVQEDYLALRRHPIPGVGDLAGAARERMRLSGMSEGQIAAVARTGRVQRETAVTAPASGVVTELNVREGMTVAAGQPLARIASLDPIWIDVQVPQGEAEALRPGGPASVEGAGSEGGPLPGRILALLPKVAPETRTRAVRVAVPNPARRLVPGMSVTVRFTPAAGSTRLLIPSEALIRTGKRTLVFVDRGAAGYVPVAVVAGRESGGQVEILAGLSRNDRVVVSGQFLLDSEASVRGIAPLPPTGRGAVAAPADKRAGQ
jgi:membrane fusion protein, copper/silver efflux system